jgi:hypothetical protein
MRYELRTTFDVHFTGGVSSSGGAIDNSDRLLRWLYEYLPTKATLGSDLVLPRWVGSRYNDDPTTFQVITWYRDVFAATADRLRIVAGFDEAPVAVKTAIGDSLRFEVFRVFGDADLVDWADPTKPKITFP